MKDVGGSGSVKGDGLRERGKDGPGRLPRGRGEGSTDVGAGVWSGRRRRNTRTDRKTPDTDGGTGSGSTPVTADRTDVSFPTPRTEGWTTPIKLSGSCPLVSSLR